PSVGVFVDGVYRSRTSASLADLPNLERIEVLRGPQSTLFGKNASAGVISIVTRAPDPLDLEGQVRTNFSITSGSDDLTQFRSHLELGLTDEIAVALSGFSNTREGYFLNRETGTMINERDRFGIRADVSYIPNDTSSYRLIIDADEADETCCGVINLVNGPTAAAVVAVGGNLVPENAFNRSNFYDFDPTNVIKNKGISMTAEFELANGMQLTSIGAFRDHSRFENGDIDYTSARLVEQNVVNSDLETLTSEVRLTGTMDDLDWMVGLYYFSEEVAYDTTLTWGEDMRDFVNILAGGGLLAAEVALSPTLGFPLGTFFATGQGDVITSGQDDTTISLFAQGDYQLSDQLTLTAGVNLTDVQKDAFLSQTNDNLFSQLDFVQIGFGAAFQSISTLPPTPANIAAVPAAAAAATAISTTACSAANPPPACNSLLAFQPLQLLPLVVQFPNAVESGSSSDSQATYTLRLAYDWTDSINVYGSIGTGFKATSWNLSRDSKPTAANMAALGAAGLLVPNATASTRFADPEESTVIEFGLKGSWGRNYLNVAVFNQEIDGFQSNLFLGTGFALVNAGTQTAFGVEVDSLWAPSSNFTLGFSGIWMDPEYDSFELGNGPTGPVDLSGTQPAGIHDLSFSLSATYLFDINGDWAGSIRGNYLYESDVQVVENVTAAVASREVGTLNASITATYQDNLEISFWGRNITGDDYLLSAFPSVAQAGSISGYPNQPHTWGLTVRTTLD
ncbi:MAG: TonB-dependent receptor, partial [Pseudomonadota bacterium]